MKKIIIASLLSLSATVPAFAADEGFYVAADLSTWSLSNLGTASNPSAGLGIFGGYKFSPMLAAEVGYVMSGSGSDLGMNYKVNSTQLAAVGTFPINNQFDVFAKLGYASNKLTGDLTTGCTNCSKSGLMYGIGGQFNINRQIGIRVQYASLGKATDFGTNDVEAKTTSIGAVFKF